ncbi:MAG: deoxyguanosinetriphosphate triphosphohydrolase [Clostridia bacterium]|nr:deoxyguanosinetriphosphate triphosphohydrolase [Clostridia bacterium]
MDHKKIIYDIEEMGLSPYAAKSAESKGRERSIEECPYRTEYMRDRDRITHSKSFRRLKHKTQVFLSPEGDHYRTRLTHTLEVAQIGRTIARTLRLNEDLTEAIALGHDLGHTPFGHAGERTLSTLTEEGFRHYEQSVRVAKYLENDGKGLNLTFEVLDGILNHTSEGSPSTLEGKVVSYADRIAYLNHDIDDAIRAKILSEEDIPMRHELGKSKGERITYFIGDIVNNSYGKDIVSMSKEGEERLGALRKFMFDNVYRNPLVMKSEDTAAEMLGTLFDFYFSRFETLPDNYIKLAERFGVKRVVIDYIASMTDIFAMDRYYSIKPKN